MRVHEKIGMAFNAGKPKKLKNYESTGTNLYYHGNKIAEWREDGLYISNGGYGGNHGETGSVTTRDRLRSLNGVNLEQRKFQWYLNGEVWNGEWIKVPGINPPAIDTKKAGDVFDTSKEYIKTDGWRGYSKPVYAVAGANDTGTWDDSPCNSNVCEKELNGVKADLKKAGIPVKLVTCETSNVFCVHHYLVPKVKDVERARVIVQEFIKNNDTSLLYAS
jgi:hypothetical protein